MRTLKNLLAAGAASLISTAALAADLPMPPPYIPPPVQDFGGWYLRGDIGLSNQRIKERHYSRYDTTILPGSLDQTTDFKSAGIFGIGAGYQFNSWFRADVTGEYRAKSNYTGRDTFQLLDSSPGIPDNYTGHKSEWLFLANAYADLGTWWCITPFVGAGIGTARVTMGGFRDFHDDGTLTGLAPDASKWNFAWALHAGLAYKISPSWTMELAYRYVDMGDGATGSLYNAGTGFTINQPMNFRHITSHDVRLGVRWAIDPTPSYAPPMLPPLIRKG